MPRPVDIAHSLRLAELLDTRFEVLGVRFGIDPLIGLIPVLGDTLSLILGLIIVRDALRLRVRKRAVARMLLNLGVDWLIGQIPVLGDAADFFVRPNARNAEILRRELERRAGHAEP